MYLPKEMPTTKKIEILLLPILNSFVADSVCALSKLVIHEAISMAVVSVMSFSQAICDQNHTILF
jgi:hypothetical protein